jgi:hypothetical protein
MSNDNQRAEKWKVIEGQSAELEMKLKMEKQLAPDDIEGRLAKLGELNKDLRSLVNAFGKAANE